MRCVLTAIAVLLATATPAAALEAHLSEATLAERWLPPVSLSAASGQVSLPEKDPWFAAALAAVPLWTGLGSAAIDLHLANYARAPLPVADLAIAPSTLITVRNGLRIVTVPSGGLGHFYAGGLGPGSLASMGLPLSVAAGMGLGFLADTLRGNAEPAYNVGFTYLGGVLAGAVYQGFMVRQAYDLAGQQP